MPSLSIGYNGLKLNKQRSEKDAIVVELVDTPSWGGGGASCGGSSPPNRTKLYLYDVLLERYKIGIIVGNT